MKAEFYIDKAISMADEEINIKLIGLPLYKEITVQAKSNDYYCINSISQPSYGSLWFSEVKFQPSTGEVDLSKDSAVSGYYTGVHSMGLLYNMKPIKNVDEKRNDNLNEIPLYKNYHIKLSAYCEGEKLCETTIERVYQNNKIISQDVNEKYLLGRYFTSEEKIKLPAIIVLSGSDGRIEKAQNIAQLFASHGFSTLAVCYFGLNGTSSSLQNIPLEIIEDAINFLKKQENVMSDKIAIYGRSKGGELALLSGSMFSEISCVVANTPSYCVMEGINTKRRNSKSSSWSYQSKQVPYIPFYISTFIPYILKRIFLKKNDLKPVYLKLLKKSDTNKAKIPIEKINGDILLLSSENDEIWPSSIFCKRAIDELKKHKFKFLYEHKNFIYSGHHLTVAYQPNPRYESTNWKLQLSDGIKAWNKTLEFLRDWSKGE